MLFRRISQLVSDNRSDWVYDWVNDLFFMMSRQYTFMWVTPLLILMEKIKVFFFFIKLTKNGGNPFSASRKAFITTLNVSILNKHFSKPIFKTRRLQISTKFHRWLCNSINFKFFYVRKAVVITLPFVIFTWKQLGIWSCKWKIKILHCGCSVGRC